MLSIRLAKKNREKNPKSFELLYENLIVQKIRTKYSLSNELAILRQRDNKPEEFAEYNDFVERCKTEVKAEMER